MYKCGANAIMWLCKCDCGNTVIRSRANLQSKTKFEHSCGCVATRERAKGVTKHGYSHNKLYNIYHSMRSRCYNQKDKRYKTYGGRGIKVCDEWLGENGFINFANWAMSVGWDESKDGRTEQSIDRIDNDKPYSPDNCKFSTSLEQAQHTTRSHLITFNGKTKTLSEWDRECGFPRGTITQRINVCKMSEADAITRPLRVSGGGHFRYIESMARAVANE